MFDINIKVKEFEFKIAGIIINKSYMKSYIIPRNLPIEIQENQIKFIYHTNIVLKFNDLKQKNEFLEQIGVKQL